MADWPDTDELAQVLNIAPDQAVTDWQTTLDRVLASAIDKVKGDTGNWDSNVDEPDDRLAQAALRMAAVTSPRPELTTDVLAADPAYRALMSGKRRRFAVS